jgi:hypothetical protein
MIENEVSFTSIYTNELESIKNSEKIFKDKKDIYEEKMVSLQEVLNKSNQTFINFKTAIDKIRK